MKEKRKNRSILSSTLARVVAFFLLAISCVVGVTGTIMTAMLWEEDAYTSGIATVIKDAMSSMVVWDDVSYVKTLYQEGDMVGIEAYLDKRNIDMEIYISDVPEGEERILLWSNYDGFETKYSFNCFTEMRLTRVTEPRTEGLLSTESTYTYEDDETSETDMNQEIDRTESADTSSVDYGVAEKHYYAPNEIVEEWKDALFRVYVDDTFPCEDEYKSIHTWGMYLGECLYVIPIVSVISIFVFFGSFIFLMCSAGHHRNKEGITGGVLYFFSFDVVTFVFGVVACVWFMLMVELAHGGFSFVEAIILLAILVVEVVWCTIYCMDLAVELKIGTIFKHTLIYVILRQCGKGVKALWRGFLTLMRGLPLVTGAIIAYIGFSIVQFIVLAFFCELWYMDWEVLVLCFLEKIILLPIVLYFALVCKKLQQGSEALAEGNLLYKLDTTKMLFGFKEHGDNLNRIGEGIAVAVDERMKSEHLKTELITNVSHDLKTPLTSIINYADLIGTAVNSGVDGENDRTQLTEYSEVLLRQSKRLKKLLEDLVEASKATTGNLEVKLETCEISVILSQAVGEYMQRFSEKELILLVRQPEEPVYIQADGRHLWRVFDNLLNNVCKYAQESTRVYLTVEPKGEAVEIVFRNMSKYQLEVSAEELQERFVRGDKSRHMEGNGLGLSIAGSLVELQGGAMEIVTDGDLFKVILRFPQKFAVNHF